MPQASSKKTTGISDTFINHCLQQSHFPKPWKEARVITLLKPGKDPKFLKNLCLISLLSTTGKLFEKVIPKLVHGTLKKEKCLMQDSMVSMPITA
jgi:hypothetical protein